MKKTKRIISLVLCLTLGLALLAGCGAKITQSSPTNTPSASGPPASPPPVVAAPSTPPPDVEFVDHLTMISETIAVIDPFNPAFTSAWTGVVSHMMYDALFYYTLDNTYEPALAKSYETDDAKTWKFYLRDDVYFHNGEKFTAADVVWTMETAKNSPGTLIYDIAKQIESFNVINDYELEIILSEVNIDFIFNISQPTASIVNQKAYEDDLKKDRGSEQDRGS